MNPQRILLPLDIRKCPLEIFSIVENFTRRPDVTLILLHVIHLNIRAPDNRLYDELALEAGLYLERLAQLYVHPPTSTILHVRLGQRAQQILEEAQAEKSELLILPTYEPSLWSRLVSVWKPGSRRKVSLLAKRILRDSTCSVFVANVKTRFNCEKEWGRGTGNNGLALDYSLGTSGHEASSSNAEATQLSACRSDRAA